MGMPYNNNKRMDLNIHEYAQVFVYKVITCLHETDQGIDFTDSVL